MKKLVILAALSAAVGVLVAPGTANATTPQASALSYARGQLGDPYRLGGTGPRYWDCSGLTMKAYAHAGKTLPRTAQQQYNATRHVALSSARPGDLLFWGKDSKHITHVGVYTGGGYTVNANTGAYRGRKVVNAPTREYRLYGNREYAGQVK